MLEAYKRRLRVSGNNMSEAIKYNNDKIMDATFTNSINYKKARINNDEVDIRFIPYRNHTISDNSIDYLLQFRPNVTYPVGTYVSIPNEQKIYEDWLIVGKSDAVLFPKYNVLKCNYVLKWISDREIKEYKAVLRSHGSNLGLTGNDFMVVLDGKLSVWLPSTTDVQLIDYKTRFMISSNKNNPRCYKVEGIEDVLTQGITKLILTRDECGVYDNVDLMIADYYKYFPDENTNHGQFSHQLIGSDSIVVNTSAKYEVQTIVNDEIVETTGEVVFDVVDDNGQATDLATYTVHDNKIEIHASNKKGFIILKVDIDGVIVTKRIRIKGLL